MPKTTPKPPKALRGGLDEAVAVTTPKNANRTNDEQIAVRLKAKLASVCSGQWQDEVSQGRTDYPVPGMMLGKAKVLTPPDRAVDTEQSNNRGETGTRRYTPPQNVAMEDGIDLLPIGRAHSATAGWPSAATLATPQPKVSTAIFDPRDKADPWLHVTRWVKIGNWPAHKWPAEVVIVTGVE